MAMTSNRGMARRLSWGFVAVTLTAAAVIAPSSAAVAMAAPAPALPAAEVTPTPTPEITPTPTPGRGRPTPEPTPTPAARFTVLATDPICDGDMPFLGYEIEVEGTAATTATIIFLHPTDPEQDVVYADLPLSGRVLWPGAIPAGPDRWSGLAGPGARRRRLGRRRGVRLEPDQEVQWPFQANPEAIVSVAYLLSTADRDPNAPDGGVGGATGTPNVTLLRPTRWPRGAPLPPATAGG